MAVVEMINISGLIRNIEQLEAERARMRHRLVQEDRIAEQERTIAACKRVFVRAIESNNTTTEDKDRNHELMEWYRKELAHVRT